MKTQPGFTLFELIVTIAVLGIVATIAVPSMASMINSSRIKTATYSILGMAQQARSEAIRTGHSIIICASSDGNNCDSANPLNWQQGLIIKDAVTSAVYKVADFKPSSLQITGPSTTGQVTFNSVGAIAGVKQITVGIDGTVSQTICISVSGRAGTLKSGETCQ